MGDIFKILSQSLSSPNIRVPGHLLLADGSPGPQQLPQQLRVQLGMKYDHHLIYLFIVIVNHLFFSAVRMTPIQRRLYRRFMEELITNRCVSDPLKAFAVCCKIWNHSDVLHNYLLKREKDDLYLLEAEAECAPSPAPPGGRPWGPESVSVCQE